MIVRIDRISVRVHAIQASFFHERLSPKSFILNEEKPSVIYRALQHLNAAFQALCASFYVVRVVIRSRCQDAVFLDFEA